MTLTYQDVDSFFEQYGWGEYVQKSGENKWYVNVKSEKTNYNFYVDLSEYFLFVCISPYLEIPEDDKCKFNLYDHLLRLNRDISVTKFVISGDIIELSGILSSESIQYEEFEAIINLLLYNADNNYSEIMNLAEDCSAISSYLQESGE
jgi:hypothetical protein